MNQNCCERCRRLRESFDWPDGMPTYYCTNPSCPCHSPSSQEKQECSCGKEVHTKEDYTVQPSAEWEEEVFGWLNTNLTPQALVNKIRPLVRKVVEQARERGETSAGRDNYRHAEKEGRTAALKGVVEKINKILMQHGTFEDPLTDTLSDLKQSITSLIEKK